MRGIYPDIASYIWRYILHWRYVLVTSISRLIFRPKHGFEARWASVRCDILPPAKPTPTYSHPDRRTNMPDHIVTRNLVNYFRMDGYWSDNLSGHLSSFDGIVESKNLDIGMRIVFLNTNATRGLVIIRNHSTGKETVGPRVIVEYGFFYPLIRVPGPLDKHGLCIKDPWRCFQDYSFDEILNYPVCHSNTRFEFEWCPIPELQDTVWFEWNGVETIRDALGWGSKKLEQIELPDAFRNVITTEIAKHGWNIIPGYMQKREDRILYKDKCSGEIIKLPHNDQIKIE